MDKYILNGFKMAFGFCLFIGILFGLVFAAGVHTPSEILSGTFIGDYVFTNTVGFEDNVNFNSEVNFTNDVDFSYANVSGVSTDSGVPIGSIVMWSGTIASIPEGWALCDGSNGTPDLTNRFVYSVASSAEDPGTTGGTSTHSHTIDPPATGTTSVSTLTVSKGTGTYKECAPAHSHTVNIAPFTSAAGNNLPPYYKIAFIMKIS